MLARTTPIRKLQVQALRGSYLNFDGTRNQLSKGSSEEDSIASLKDSRSRLPPNQALYQAKLHSVDAAIRSFIS